MAHTHHYGGNPNKRNPVVVGPIKPMAEEPKPEQKMHPVVEYIFRTIGFAVVMLGVAGLVTGFSFMLTAICIYVGLSILAVDPWLEPKLRPFHIGWRIGISMFFVFGIVAFTWFVVFFNAPITRNIESFNGKYKPGSTIYGIKWDEYMSDLRIDLSNNTDRDYDALDVRLTLTDDKQVRAYGFIRSYPHCDIVPTAKEFHVNLTDAKGNVTGEEIDSLSGWPELRLVCERLPKHTTIPLILAIAEYSEEVQKLRKPESATLTVDNMHYWLLNSDDPQHDKVWRYALPRSVRILGDYKVMGRSHHIDVTEEPVRR